MAARFREKAKPQDAHRIVSKSSEQGEPPRAVDPIEELVRIVGQTHDDPRSRNDAGATGIGAGRIRSRRLEEAMNSDAPGKNLPLLPSGAFGKQRTANLRLIY
jgi:hypothetical protein